MCVMCHMSPDTYQVKFFLFIIILTNGGFSRWRVCYQQGRPRLILKSSSSKTTNKQMEHYVSSIGLALISFTSLTLLLTYDPSLLSYSLLLSTNSNYLGQYSNTKYKKKTLFSRGLSSELTSQPASAPTPLLLLLFLHIAKKIRTISENK